MTNESHHWDVTLKRRKETPESRLLSVSYLRAIRRTQPDAFQHLRELIEEAEYDEE
jgi:hypothetical protein